MDISKIFFYTESKNMEWNFKIECANDIEKNFMENSYWLCGMKTFNNIYMNIILDNSYILNIVKNFRLLCFGVQNIPLQQTFGSYCLCVFL